MYTAIFTVIALSMFSSYNGSPISAPEYEYPEHQISEHKKPVIPIIKQDFEQHHDGYQYSYETGNGIHVEEQGFIKHKGDKKHETLVQQGRVTYHDEHGHPITLTYIADEHGFQPQGDHLPTPPPIPEEIAKSLEQSAHQPKYEEQSHEEHSVPQQHQHQQYEQY